MLVRLQKALAAAGVASRREAETLIASGRVSVDGQVVREPGTRVDPAAARIAVDGRGIARAVPRLYLLLNKPSGFVTTRRDPHAQRTVMDLVQPSLRARFGADHPSVAGLHPVGRLDVDTEGLLLLTNDGDFTFALTHPAREVTKTYRAVVRGVPDDDALAQLRAGVDLEGRRTAPARACRLWLDPGGQRATLEIEIHEGRNRQVRRMLAAVGHRVLQLKRVAVGPLTLGDLPEGEWRLLTPAEVERLRAAGAPAAGPREARGTAERDRE
jgi:pseudouridine synthase